MSITTAILIYAIVISVKYRNKKIKLNDAERLLRVARDTIKYGDAKNV